LKCSGNYWKKTEVEFIETFLIQEIDDWSFNKTSQMYDMDCGKFNQTAIDNSFTT